ncbi:MAG: hypothetical protein ABIS26_01045 [Candidatus Paceibacterota bacterium]
MKNDLNYKALLTLFAIMALGVYLFPSSANALTMTPTRFEISGNPGDSLSEEILIINETEGTETFYPSFANFEAQGESGSPAFVEPKEGLGSWMTTSTSSVTLAAGQQKIIPFSITIPKDAEPGGHFAVIFWGTSSGASSGVAIGAKTGILVLLSVNGDVKESAGLLDFNTTNKQFFYKTLPVSFEYRLKNDGGDRIKPVGFITIRDTVFFPAEKLDANKIEGNVLPNSTRKIKVDWQKYERPVDYVVPTNPVKKFFSNVRYEWKNFALGFYSANLNVAYGLHGQQAKKTVFFFVFPWELVIILIIVLAILFFGGRTFIRRYNRSIIEKARVGRNMPPESSYG